MNQTKPRQLRVFRRQSDGQHFIETPEDLWERVYKLYREDDTRAAPLPMGHWMFKPKADPIGRIFTISELDLPMPAKTTNYLQVAKNILREQMEL